MMYLIYSHYIFLILYFMSDMFNLKKDELYIIKGF